MMKLQRTKCISLVGENVHFPHSRENNLEWGFHLDQEIRLQYKMAALAIQAGTVCKPDSAIHCA